jgi:glucose-1-phosphate cytidylyltransferase
VAILCGGRGTRLGGVSAEIPKALVEVGGRPLIWHVVSSYRRQGFDEFLFLTGHLGEQLADYSASGELPAGGSYRAIATGESTPTGERLLRAREDLDSGTFCLTYVDGLADLDLDAEVAFHRGHGRVGTITLVQPRLQWGVAELEEDRVRGFTEKPVSDRWINGGFFCFEPAVFDWLKEGESLERGPLEGLAAAGELRAFFHRGFWDCVDTYKDLLEVNGLCEKGEAPWLAPW